MFSMMKIAVVACGLVALNFHGCKSKPDGKKDPEACVGLTPKNYDSKLRCKECADSYFDNAEIAKKIKHNEVTPEFIEENVKRAVEAEKKLRT